MNTSLRFNFFCITYEWFLTIYNLSKLIIPSVMDSMMAYSSNYDEIQGGRGYMHIADGSKGFIAAI